MEKLTKFIFIFGTAMICLTIFFFSAQNLAKSDEVSGIVANKIQSSAEVVIKEETALETFKKVFVEKARKWAHAVLYFVMGIMLMGLLCYSDMSMKKRIAITIVLCFLYGCTDEFHQLFSDGRGSRFSDVLIDTAGATVASLLVSGLVTSVKKRIKSV